MNHTTSLAGAVLAGGESRRMGRDKALIELDGEPLLLRAVRALRDAGADPVIIVGGDPDVFEAIGLTAVPDSWPGEGPLGGIITALRALEATSVAVLSCDLTQASSMAVRTVAGALGDADVAVPAIEGRQEWLHAVWRRGCVDVLEEAFERGVRAPRHAVGGLRVAQLLDADPCWFHDADRPEDLPPPAP